MRLFQGHCSSGMIVKNLQHPLLIDILLEAHVLLKLPGNFMRSLASRPFCTKYLLCLIQCPSKPVAHFPSFNTSYPFVLDLCTINIFSQRTFSDSKVRFILPEYPGILLIRILKTACTSHVVPPGDTSGIIRQVSHQNPVSSCNLRPFTQSHRQQPWYLSQLPVVWFASLTLQSNLQGKNFAHCSILCSSHSFP